MDIGTPSTVHLTQLGAGIGPIIARELHGGGEFCNWRTIHQPSGVVCHAGWQQGKPNNGRTVDQAR
jgi:hypothetical protein